MIHWLGHLLGWVVALSIVGGLFWIDFILWRWTLRFLKREWRRFRGDVEESKPRKPRYGYLKVTSAEPWRAIEVAVVPWDGGEPIILPVYQIKVKGHVYTGVQAELTAAVNGISLHGGRGDQLITIEGASQKPEHKLSPSRIQITDSQKEPVHAKGFIWTHRPDEAFPRLYLRGRREA